MKVCVLQSKMEFEIDRQLKSMIRYRIGIGKFRLGIRNRSRRHADYRAEYRSRDQGS